MFDLIKFDGTAAGGGDMLTGGDMMGTLYSIGLLVLMFVVFYFLLIRPQRKRDKEMKQQMEISVAIANRIYEILEIKGMTQKDLAQRLGKTETEVSRWLSGTHNLTLSTICKISTALGEDIVTVPNC